MIAQHTNIVIYVINVVSHLSAASSGGRRHYLLGQDC